MFRRTNSLHFVRDKKPVLALVRILLRPGGRLIVVEYNVDHGNAWVPYPLSFERWRALADEVGFVDTRLLGSVLRPVPAADLIPRRVGRPEVAVRRTRRSARDTSNAQLVAGVMAAGAPPPQSSVPGQHQSRPRRRK